jgi:multidrug resistance efflux pump
MALLQLEQAQWDIRRVQNLQHENIISTRKFREQKTHLDIAKVNAQASQSQSETLRLQTDIKAK